ncbi:MAG: hypothetical protein FWB98_09230 [Defluviitaleaceae bacterium]|nr:hypothetical protein [Defluviitaleaceae bacterium]
MQSDSNRKVVMLKGTRDKWYEQAIFILKEGAVQGEMDCIKEAERIINGRGLQNILADKYNYTTPPAYIPAATTAQIAQKKPGTTATPQKNKKLDSFLNMGLILTGIAVVALITYHFL